MVCLYDLALCSPQLSLNNRNQWALKDHPVTNLDPGHSSFVIPVVDDCVREEEWKHKQEWNNALHVCSDPHIFLIFNPGLTVFETPWILGEENCQFYYFECQAVLKTDVAP